MKKLKKYVPFFIGVVFLTILFTTKKVILNEWISFVAVIIGVIILFEFIESSRKTRLKKWYTSRPSKYLQIIKFSLFLGLPISVIIILIFHNKADLIYSILFIAIPLIIIFGWIGLLDWQTCDKKYLEEKYKVPLQK